MTPAGKTGAAADEVSAAAPQQPDKGRGRQGRAARTDGRVSARGTAQVTAERTARPLVGRSASCWRSSRWRWRSPRSRHRPTSRVSTADRRLRDLPCERPHLVDAHQRALPHLPHGLPVVAPAGSAGPATRRDKTWAGRAPTPAARPPATCAAEPPSPMPCTPIAPACTTCHPVSASRVRPVRQRAPHGAGAAARHCRADGGFAGRDRHAHGPAVLLGRHRALRRREADFTVTSDEQIAAVVPEPAVSGPVTVLSPGGTATSSVDFVVLRPVAPTLTLRATPATFGLGRRVRLAGLLSPADSAVRRSPSSCSAAWPVPGRPRPPPRARRTRPAPTPGRTGRGMRARTGRAPRSRRRASGRRGPPSASARRGLPGRRRRRATGAQSAPRYASRTCGFRSSTEASSVSVTFPVSST